MSSLLSRSSERILILVFLWYKATIFQGIGGNCRLLILSGASRPGNWTPFRLDRRTRIRNQCLPLVLKNNKSIIHLRYYLLIEQP